MHPAKIMKKTTTLKPQKVVYFNSQTIHCPIMIQSHCIDDTFWLLFI